MPHATYVIFKGNRFPHSNWLGSLKGVFKLLRANRSYSHFNTWYRILTPRYQVWMSDPTIIKNENGLVEWAICFLREANCHPDGVEVYEALIEKTLTLLPGSNIRE